MAMNWPESVTGEPPTISNTAGPRKSPPMPTSTAADTMIPCTTRNTRSQFAGWSRNRTSSTLCSESTVTMSGARESVIVKMSSPRKAASESRPTRPSSRGKPLTSTADDTEASTVRATFQVRAP